MCLHGVSFGLSKKKTVDIIGDLSHFKDLSVHSRLMVSAICKDGFGALKVGYVGSFQMTKHSLVKQFVLEL